MSGRILGLALLAILSCMAAAKAGPLHPSLVTTGLTSVPVGAREFCTARPDDCAPVPPPSAPLGFSEILFEQLVAVNVSWNGGIRPVTDRDGYQREEFWTYPDGFGDCEDFALAKRRDLLAQGWPPSALRLAMVRQRNGEAHAVLVALTDAGDFVLDNLVPDILGWDETDYRFIKIQSPVTLDEWLGIEDPRRLWGEGD